MLGRAGALLSPWFREGSHGGFDPALLPGGGRAGGALSLLSRLGVEAVLEKIVLW